MEISGVTKGDLHWSSVVEAGWRGSGRDAAPLPGSAGCGAGSGILGPE